MKTWLNERRKMEGKEKKMKEWICERKKNEINKERKQEIMIEWNV